MLVTHGAVIHGHRVGNNVLLGINSVILESAQIGDYCLVGAGAVVRANARIPDGSLVVGVPGQVRPLSEENRKRLEDPTGTYVANAARYKRAGLGVE